MSLKLKTTSNGSVTLSPQDTASDVVVTVPSTAGSFVTANSSGNVGIGTSSPTEKLDVQGTIKLTNTINSANFSSLVDGGGLIITSGNSNPMYFYTGGTERARIDSSGNLLVGTTSALAAARVVARGVQGGLTSLVCEATGTGIHYQIVFANSNGSVGRVETSGSSTLYATSSDYRLKENVAPMTGALQTVAQLKPCTYTWKADGSAGQGFIAHELQAVVPDCVTGEKDAVDADGNPQYQGVDTSFLVATLVSAIQELNAKVTALEAQLQGAA